VSKERSAACSMRFTLRGRDRMLRADCSTSLRITTTTLVAIALREFGIRLRGSIPMSMGVWKVSSVVLNAFTQSMLNKHPEFFSS
jgi:hypothetical protein